MQDGNNTNEDCDRIRLQCSFDYKNPNELQLFSNNNAIAIHSTNAKIYEYNNIKLTELGKPILKLNAINGNNTDTKQLEPTLYLAI